MHIFNSVESVRKIVSEAYMLLKSKLPGVMESMALYLASKETEYILFKPIKVSAGHIPLIYIEA